MKIIEAKNLSIGYGSCKIQTRLNFAVKDDDFICIVGSNGSGKTTLVLTLLQLIPKLAGKLTFSHLRPTEIGYMPQLNRLALDFPATVHEIVQSGTLTNQRKEVDSDHVLEKFNLKTLKHAKFAELSGGQKQRVLLARAVVAAQKLLILDEPYNNLDQAAREKLYLELRELNRSGVAILMITHDLDHSSLIGDKTLALLDGDYYFGPTNEYLKQVHRSGGVDV